jgi:putative endonuclease
MVAIPLTAMSRWLVYILRCADGSYYTGITNNLDKRLREHDEGRGSKYVRSRRPFSLVYSEKASGRGRAQRRESAIKKMTRQGKRRLIAKKPG